MGAGVAVFSPGFSVGFSATGFSSSKLRGSARRMAGFCARRWEVHRRVIRNKRMMTGWLGSGLEVLEAPGDVGRDYGADEDIVLIVVCR